MQSALNYILEEDDVFDEFETVERLLRTPLLYSTRRHYFTEFGESAFLSRFRLTKSSALEVLALIEKDIEYPNDKNPRTRDWWPSPLVMFTVIPFYLYFSNNLGPRLMKDQKPFKLKRVIFYYNIFQILISAYILYVGVFAGWWPFSSNSYNWTCQPVDMDDNPTTQRMHNAFWWYTVVKFIDMLDTVFFVLRKKDRQISFLHVFHHSMMPVASYIGVKYFPNGHATLLGLINCLVHVVMYTYYLISGLGSRYQKYLWWKRHLTSMQLIQFGIIFLHNLSAVYQDCGYPKWISTTLCVHSLQFLYMFGNFYYVTYIKNAKHDGTNGSIKSETGKSKVN